MILNDGIENDLWCKTSSKVPCHSHGDETWITKKFLFIKFHYHPIPLLSIVMYWNEFYEEKEMIEIDQT